MVAIYCSERSVLERVNTARRQFPVASVCLTVVQSMCSFVSEWLNARVREVD